MKQVKSCGHCQTEFAGRPNRHYCSDSCKRQAQQTRQVALIAPVAGSPTPSSFKQSAAQVPSSRHRGLSLAVVQAQAKSEEQRLAMQMADKESERKHQRYLQKRQQQHERTLAKAGPPTPLASPTDQPLLSPLPRIEPDQSLPSRLTQEELVDSAAEETSATSSGWLTLAGLFVAGKIAYDVIQLCTQPSKPPVVNPPKTLDEIADQLYRTSINKAKPGTAKG